MRSPQDPMKTISDSQVVHNVRQVASVTSQTESRVTSLERAVQGTTNWKYEWLNWTPTITGLSASSIVGRYTVLPGNTVKARVRFTLNSAPTTQVSIALPTTPHASWASSPVSALGSAVGLRQGDAYYTGVPALWFTNEFIILPNGGVSGWGAGVPVAWAGEDMWGIEVSYEMAQQV